MADQSRPATGYPATGYPQNGYPAANTAYPYAAPPPQATHYNPNPYYSDPSSPQPATLLRRVFTILIGAVIITGTILVIVWLILRPQYPEFRVDSLSLSNFNSSSSASLISGNWDVRFTVRNPNHKLTLYYNNVGAFILYQGAMLSETTIPPFNQDTKNETAIRASFAAYSSYLDPRLVEGINADKARGTVYFNVRMVAQVRFKAGGWRARRRFLRGFCGGLPVAISGNSTNGSLLGSARQCRVGLWWDLSPSQFLVICMPRHGLIRAIGNVMP